MDQQSVEMGMMWGFAFVAIPVSALIAFVVVFQRVPLIIDGRLINAARRKAFDRISEAHCGDRRDEDLEISFCEIALDCITESYLVFNPDTRIKPEKLRKRFGANCLVIGNAAILRMYFGKNLEVVELEAQNIPIDRELRLKRPADVAPNGGGIKTAKPPAKPTPKQAATSAPARPTRPAK